MLRVLLMELQQEAILQWAVEAEVLEAEVEAGMEAVMAVMAVMAVVLFL